MNKNILRRAKLVSEYIKGISVNLGSEESNWETDMHSNMEKFSGKKILRVDKFGNPDVKTDLNYKFPFENCRFDTVIATDIIEHIENPLHFLQECRRILKDDGKIILITANTISPSEWVVASKSQAHGKEYGVHLYNWHKQNFLELIKCADLKVKKFEYIELYWRKNLLLKLFTHLIPMFKPSLFVIAEK